jgi:predicted enzyme related to lactoylglutathione lyase
MPAVSDTHAPHGHRRREQKMPERTSYEPGEPSWVDLATGNLEGSITFYGELFGWKPERGGEEYGGYTIFVRDGRTVAGASPLVSEQQDPGWACYVSIEDADATAALVAEHQGTVHAPPTDVADVGRMAVFADPAGAVFRVWQPRAHIGAGLQGDEGTFAWIELAARDQEQVLPFYEAVFGWKANREPGYTEMELNGRAVAGCMELPSSVPASVGPYWMPYFIAEDPGGTAERVTTLGGTIMVPFTEIANVGFAVVRDPQQAMFGLLNLRHHV